MKPVTALVLAAGLALADTAFAVDVYKWKDSKGVVHYGDRPASGVAASTVSVPGGGASDEEIAGEPITEVTAKAPGNGAAIGGIRVSSKSGWFAARPSGTEEIYKIYAESFDGEAHLKRLLDEAQALVDKAIAG